MTGIISLIIVAIVLINGCVLTYTAYRKLPLLEKHLDRCPAIIQNLETLKSCGFIGRNLRQAWIWAAISDKEKLHIQGLVDKKQIERLPRDLRLWIQIPQTINLTTLALMIPIFIYIKLAEFNY